MGETKKLTEAGAWLNQVHPYERWIESLNVPIYRGYFMEDLGGLKLGRWEDRECDAAFLQLAGQEGVSAIYLTEVPAGKTLRPFRMAIDELVYVIQGGGLTTIWSGERPKRVFEWQKHSFFLLPANYTYQLSNMRGSEPARLLHCSGLPTAMAAIPDPEFYFQSAAVDLSVLYGTDEGQPYSKIQVITDTRYKNPREVWIGNFFSDMLAWYRLEAYKGRGAGGHVVWISFPRSLHVSHMSVFPSGTYKKAHRHGPGVVVLVLAGEGYSIMWPEQGADKVVIPWHEGSVFVPPNNWWHQHLNPGREPARYLALHAPTGMPTGNAYFTNSKGEKLTVAPEEDPANQIEYPDEDPWIRKKFEEELAKSGLKSLMPDEAYRDRDFEWRYSEDKNAS
jgi:mannose-6-phosphate isomerase-like protein (cupin superfamily)